MIKVGNIIYVKEARKTLHDEARRKYVIPGHAVALVLGEVGPEMGDVLAEHIPPLLWRLGLTNLADVEECLGAEALKTLIEFFQKRYLDPLFLKKEPSEKPKSKLILVPERKIGLPNEGT